MPKKRKRSSKSNDWPKIIKSIGVASERVILATGTAIANVMQDTAIKLIETLGNFTTKVIGAWRASESDREAAPSISVGEEPLRLTVEDEDAVADTDEGAE